MLKVIRKKVEAVAAAEHAPLTANDVERLAQIANGEREGDVALARLALVRAVEDTANFREPRVLAAAERFVRHLDAGEFALRRSLDCGG